MKPNPHEWLALSQHEQWKVEYCLEDRTVRLRLGESSLLLDRDAYLLLWATLTEGLDAMEQADDIAGRITGVMMGNVPVRWPQTRH